LDELAAMSGAEPQFEAGVGALIAAVQSHVEMEEEEIFEEARKNLPEYRLEELGLEVEERKKILLSLAA
jgi:hypothetical protein